MNRYIKAHPNADLKEIAKNVRLPINRVTSLRALIMYESGVEHQQPASINTERPIMKEKAKPGKVPLPQEHETARRCPVRVGKTYDARIEDVSHLGDGIARIYGFACFVPHTRKGERVTILLRKIHNNFAEGEVLRRPLDSSAPPANPWIRRPKSVDADRMTPDEYEKQHCPSCGESVPKEEIETHDGFCTQCWLKRLQEEAEQDRRRSGTYGADRAGTW